MKKTIVCYGDSNTYGYNTTTGGRFDETKRYPRLLAALLGEDYHIVEEGLCGRTCVIDDPDIEGRNGLTYLSPCLMSHRPIDLLLIMLGTNDVKEQFFCTPEQIKDGLLCLIKKAQQTPAFRSQKPNILVLAPIPIEEDYATAAFAASMGHGCSQKSKKLTPLFETVAKQTGSHFLYAGDYASVSHFDYVHLDEQGHVSLAKALAKKIPSYF